MGTAQTHPFYTRVHQTNSFKGLFDFLVAVTTVLWGSCCKVWVCLSQIFLFHSGERADQDKPVLLNLPSLCQMPSSELELWLWLCCVHDYTNSHFTEIWVSSFDRKLATIATPWKRPRKPYHGSDNKRGKTHSCFVLNTISLILVCS